MSTKSEYSQLLVGFVTVPISLLDFDARGHYPRQVDRRIQSRLRDVFEINCEPGISANHVDGILNERELSRILFEVGASAQELKQTLHSGIYPRVEQTRIWCPNGRHRIETAIDVFGPESCWTVQLYCIPNSFTDEARKAVIQGLSERYSPQFAHSDGEVFCNARRHHASERQVQSWSVRLTPCKRVSLRMLLGDKSRMKMYQQIGGATAQATVLEAFDKLMVFPGLWEGLQLGNIHKHFALRCNEQIVAYLGHIYRVWERIAGVDPSARLFVDIETVRRLQSLAPEASAADSATICDLMDQHQIFAEAQDPALREEIKQRLLGLRTVIPTIRSFHENMKLFTILVKILRQYLIPHKPKSQLLAGLAEDWHTPQTSVVEVREGIFHTTASPLSFSLAWQQLMLIALRNFPSLCNESPKQDGTDCIRANVQPSSVDALYRSARLLGFSNRIIDEWFNSSLQGQNGPAAVAGKDGCADVEVKLTKRRLGRPHARIFRQIQRVAFFPQLHATASTRPTVGYIHRDMLSAFMNLACFEPSPEPRAISIWGHSRDIDTAHLGPHESTSPHVEPEPVRAQNLGRHRGTQTDPAFQMHAAATNKETDVIAGLVAAGAQSATELTGQGVEVVNFRQASFDASLSPDATQQVPSPVARSIDDRSLLQTPTSQKRPNTYGLSHFGRSLTGGPTLAGATSQISVGTQSDASRSLLHTPVHEQAPLFRQSSQPLLSTPHQSLQIHSAADSDVLSLDDDTPLFGNQTRSLLRTPERRSVVRPSLASDSDHMRGSEGVGGSVVSDDLRSFGPTSSSLRRRSIESIASRMDEDRMVSIDLTPPAMTPRFTLAWDSPAIRSESDRTMLETPLGSVYGGFSDSGSEHLV